MSAHARHLPAIAPWPRLGRGLDSTCLKLNLVRNLVLSSGLSLLLATAAQAQVVEPPPEVFYRRASACVAVMKRDVVSLKQRLLAGAPQLRPQMVKLTELGFTFIGTAYKRGLRKEQADALLAEAETAQKTQPAEGLKKLSTDCQAEGSRLLAKANVIERALVSNRAKARVDDLLAPPEPRK